MIYGTWHETIHYGKLENLILFLCELDLIVCFIIMFIITHAIHLECVVDVLSMCRSAIVHYCNFNESIFIIIHFPTYSRTLLTYSLITNYLL